MKVMRITGNKDLLANQERFSKEARIVGDIEVNIVCYFDIYYDGTFRHIHSGEELTNFDVLWIGGQKAITMKQGLCYKYLHLLKKKSVDERNKYEPKNHKFTQLLFADHYGLSTPKSLFFAIDPQNEDTYITIIEKSFSYPFIAKDVEKDRGEGVFLINNRESLITILSNYSFQGLLFQEFIKNQGDLRIVVVGDAVVGAFKRYNPNSFKNNISGGGESEMVTISPELSSLCVDITKDFGLGISGIDFFNIDGDYILIEINSLPQYQGLELSTGINYIQEVFKYFKTLS